MTPAQLSQLAVLVLWLVAVTAGAIWIGRYLRAARALQAAADRSARKPVSCLQAMSSNGRSAWCGLPAGHDGRHRGHAVLDAERATHRSNRGLGPAQLAELEPLDKMPVWQWETGSLAKNPVLSIRDGG